MSKFKRVLRDDEAVTIAESIGFFDGSDELFRIFSLELEQAVLAKLHEQEPVAWTSEECLNEPAFANDEDGLGWAFRSREHLLDDFCGFPNSAPAPLYAHPRPSLLSDKTDCASESVESDSQDFELLEHALKVMISAAHPAYVQDDRLREKLIKARDIAFRALETNRLNAKERHRTTKNHIATLQNEAQDIPKTIPDGWQPIETAPDGGGMPATILVLTTKDSAYTAWSMGGDIRLITPMDGVTDNYQTYGKPTHWMPLPDAPKGGSND